MINRTSPMVEIARSPNTTPARKAVPTALRRLAFGLALGVGVGACNAPALNEPAAAPASNLPPVKVDLPPLIKLEGSLPPETHPDLKMRVDGLLARREKYLGQKVLVRGYVFDKFQCPKEAKRCERPHVWLADTPAGGDKKLMLVGLSEEMVALLPEGEPQVVTGRFDRTSDDGFVQSTGLLIYESVEGIEDPVKKANAEIERRRHPR
jgi:hypothetical protein